MAPEGRPQGVVVAAKSQASGVVFSLVRARGRFLAASKIGNNCSRAILGVLIYFCIFPERRIARYDRLVVLTKLLDQILAEDIARLQLYNQRI
jgi:hypothetical protein